MKQQANFSDKVVHLMASKSWEKLTAAERRAVLQEMDQDTFENYNCLIGVSQALHQETPLPRPELKDRLMAQMQQSAVQSRKKAFWEEWFQWQVPVWQVSLASLAFVLLYLSGIHGQPRSIDANGPAQPFFHGPVDTVYLDTEQAPEDSSDQRQPLLESNIFQYLPSWFGTKTDVTIAKEDRSLMALNLPHASAHLLPPTQAMLSAQDIIPLELLEIRG